MGRFKRGLFTVGLLLLAAGYMALAQTPKHEEYRVVVQLAWWGIWLVVVGGGIALVSMFLSDE